MKTDKLEEAKALLEAEAKKAQEKFLEEYKALCIKHGMELTATPVWQITPLRK